MAEEAHKTLLHRIVRLMGRARTDDDSDGHLLDRFAIHRDEAAFTALLERHGPMVLAVCRRVLGQTADAEDAFQATFLVLLRRASALERRSTVGNWLYTVAYHTALRARANAARRRIQEQQAPTREQAETMDESARHDLRRVLDEELNRLPEKYRAPLVLCYLEGKTNDEAARLLGWTLRSVTGRLARARQALQKRLSQRGLALASAALVEALSESAAPAALPASLSERTLHLALASAAGTAVAPPVAALTEGMLRTMYHTKLKIMAALVTVGLLAPAVGVFLAVAQTRPPNGLAVQAAATAAIADRKEEASLDWVRSITNAGTVFTLAFSADGQQLASGGSPARLWDVARGQELRQFAIGGRGVDVVALSPDGKLLATGGAYTDNTVRLWDAATGKELHKLEGHSGGLNSLAFSPDGRTLASGSYKTGTVFLWDVAQGKELRRLTGKPVPTPPVAMDGTPAAFASVAWSPDGQTLANGGLYGLVRLWNAKTWDEERSFRGEVSPMGIFTRVAFLGDGPTVASWDGTPRIHIWQAADGTLLRKITSPHKWIREVAVAPDGRMLASAGEGPNVCLWEAATGQKRLELAGQGPAVNAVAFAPDGRTLAAAVGNGMIRLWDLGKRLKAVGPVTAPTAANLETWWSSLADADASRAYQAMEELALASGPAVAYLDKQMTPVPKEAPAKVARLVTDLGAQDFATRERASTELASLGEGAEPALMQTLAAKPSLEVRQRVEQLLAQLERVRRTPTAAWLQQDRAVETLEWIGTAEAGRVLRRLADGAEGARLTRQAKASLERTQRRSRTTP